MATIVRRQPRGCPRPIYCYHETYRVKVEPGCQGKGPGSGKSKVKSRDIYLGTAEEVLKKCTQGVLPEEIDRREFGLPLAALEVAREIGIAEVIDEVIPKRRQGLTVGQYILVGVLNKICHPTSRSGIREWFEKTVLPQKMGIDPALLTSQNFWDHFDLILSEGELKRKKQALARAELKEEELISTDQVARIEEGIWRRLLEKYQMILDLVLYDTTNFYTYLAPATDSFFARTGHNKKGRHELRQVGLALAITRDTELPVFHMLYHGRMHDARLFPSAMTDLVNRYLALVRDAGKLTVVFDKGNNSPENISRARKLGMWVVGSLVPSHHPDLCGVRLSRYGEMVDGKPVFRTEKEVFGIRVSVAVVYNEATYRRKTRKLRQGIQRLKEAIREAFEKNKHRPKDKIEEKINTLLADSDYGRYLEVEVGGRRHKTLRLRLNRKAYYQKLRTFGKTIIFSDNLTLSTEELVRSYTDKYQVEHGFRQLNDPDQIAFRPMYCWTDSKIRVYALMCVLALLVLNLMNYRVRRAGLTMSNAVLKAELSDIHEAVLIYSPRRAERKLTRMSPVQQKLFEVFNLARYAPAGRAP